MGFVRILCFALAVMIFAERSEATVYQVGDTTGWTIPTQNDLYDNWADNKVFRVGDQLTFTWNGVHDVAVVTEQQYDACTKVTNVSSTSPVTITLTAPGNHYYICTIGTHCQSGQKLEIEVQAANATTPAGSPPSTNTTGSPPPSSTTTNGTTQSAPPPSSASSFAPLGALCATMSLLVFSFLA